MAPAGKTGAASRFAGSFASRLLLPPQNANHKSRQEKGLSDHNGKGPVITNSSVFDSQRNSQDVGGNLTTIMPNSSMDSLHVLDESQQKLNNNDSAGHIAESEEKKFNTDRQSESDLSKLSNPNWANQRRMSSKTDHKPNVVESGNRSRALQSIRESHVPTPKLPINSYA